MNPQLPGFPSVSCEERELWGILCSHRHVHYCSWEPCPSVCPETMTSSPIEHRDWDYLSTWTQLAPKPPKTKVAQAAAQQCVTWERHQINTAPLHRRQIIYSKQINFVEVELNILLEIGENVFLKFSPRLTITGTLFKLKFTMSIKK